MPKYEIKPHARYKMSTSLEKAIRYRLSRFIAKNQARMDPIAQHGTVLIHVGGFKRLPNDKVIDMHRIGGNHWYPDLDNPEWLTRKLVRNDLAGSKKLFSRIMISQIQHPLLYLANLCT